MYLTLQALKDRFGNDPNVRFREEVVDGVSVTIVCYMLSDPDLWEKELGTETRGPCFDTATGELLSLPFEKFFNVNEKEHTQAPVVQELMDRQVPYICEKLDGSMITPVMINDKIFLKTKKSFTSDVAIEAQASMTSNVKDLCEFFIMSGVTPIFEFTSPNNKVVIDYGDKPQFKLIAGRDMKTGLYIPQEALDHWAKEFNIARPSWHINHDLQDLMGLLTHEEGIEGWVIYVGGQRFKIKTQWYIDRHRMIDIRERDVARFVLDETLDDLIPNMLAAGADMDRVREIEHEISTAIGAYRAAITAFATRAGQYPEGAARAAWINAEAGPLAKFVHRAARGMTNSDEALKDFYRQRVLPTWSLKSIGNTNFRHADED